MQGAAKCVTDALRPHFDVICDLLQNRPRAIWNLFVLYNKEAKKRNGDIICVICPLKDIKKEPTKIHA